MGDSLRITCENITEETVRKYQEDGFQLIFQEYVMEHDLTTIPEVEIPGSLALKSWSKTLEEKFYEVYVTSFKDRPGFPGWSKERWVDWISSDPAFRPDVTYLATVENHAVGFIATANEPELSDTHGYIIQVGVTPQWRRQGMAAVLTTRSLEAFRKGGKDAVILHVNQNNPNAIKLYQRLGFKSVRIRGAFQR